MAGEINYGLLDTRLPMDIGGAIMQGEGMRNALTSQQLQNQAAKMEIQNALAEQQAYKQAAQGDISAPQALMERGLGKQAATYIKSTREAEKAGLESKKLRYDVISQKFSNLAFNPSNSNIIAHLEDSVKENLMTPREAEGYAQQFLNIPPDQRSQMFTQMGAKADTVYKAQMEQQQRMQGTVPAGYRMTSEGTLEAIPGGPTTTPLAPKELQKRNADYPAATAAIKGYETKADSFVADLQKLRDHPGLENITGVIAGRTPSITAEGRAAQALYDKIVAKGGFQALQDLRAMSKTGGALGNVSNQEGKQLVQSFAAISQVQDAADVRAAIDQAIADVEGSKTRMREAYDTTYEYKLGGNTPATGDAFVTGNGTLAQREYANWKKKKAGGQ